MPTYDYWCSKCSKTYESVEHIDAEFVICKFCGYDSAERKFSMTKFAPPKPFVCNDLGNEPVQINNLSHLERECQKRGLAYEIGPTRYTRRERPREKLKKKAENSKNAFS